MQVWTPLLLIVTACSLLADDFTDLSGAGTDEKLDRATFTNTQTWNKEFLALTRKRPLFFPAKWQRSFAIPEPPANSSARTNAELDYLMKLVPERPAKLARIEKEVEVTNFQFGEYRYGQLKTDPKFTETGRLLEAAYADMAIAVFYFKERFNRVRPSILGEGQGRKLGTAIEVPSHPAYPSGHATAVHMLAYLLQELDPPNSERYRLDASQIASNREVAGVHYPSDSEAGRLLGRQIADALLSNPAFLRQFEKAKREWK